MAGRKRNQSINIKIERGLGGGEVGVDVQQSRDIQFSSSPPPPPPVSMSLNPHGLNRPLSPNSRSDCILMILYGSNHRNFPCPCDLV